MATTFAADTPLAIAGLAATDGIAGNWFRWADVLPVVIGAFIVSHLWRRSGVLTDNEMTELRYGGRPAAALRLFRALYLGVLRNAIVIGSVNLAMVKILSLALRLDESQNGLLLGALESNRSVLTLVPRIEDGEAFRAFVAYVGVKSWSSGNTDGNGYTA